MSARAKTESLTFRAEIEDRQLIEDMAREERQSKTGTIIEAVKFKAGFPKGFLKAIEPTAKNLNQPIPVVISNIVQAALAREKAWLDVFGKGYLWGDVVKVDQAGKLITSDRLLEIVYRDIKKKLEVLKAQMEADRKAGRTTVVNHESLGLLQLGA